MTTVYTVAATGADYTTVRAAFESAGCIAACAAGTPVTIKVQPGTYTASNFGLLDGDVNPGGSKNARVLIVADKLGSLAGTPGAVIISTAAFAFNMTHGVGFITIEGFDCTSSTPGTIGVSGGCVNIGNVEGTVGVTTGLLPHDIDLIGINAYNFYDTSFLNHGFQLSGYNIGVYSCRASRCGQHGCYGANLHGAKIIGNDFSYNGGRCSAATNAKGNGLRFEGDDVTVRDIIANYNKVDGVAQYVDSPYTSRRARIGGKIQIIGSGRHALSFQAGGSGETPRYLELNLRNADIRDFGQDTTNFDSSTHSLTPMFMYTDPSFTVRPWSN